VCVRALLCVFVSVFVCERECVCVCGCMCVYACVSVWLYVVVCVCVCICVCVCVYVYVVVCVCEWRVGSVCWYVFSEWERSGEQIHQLYITSNEKHFTIMYIK